MKMSLFVRSLLVAIAVSFAPFASAETNLFDPPALYLTWQRDPSTTMTIHWHTTNANAKSAVQYRGSTSSRWLRAAGGNKALIDSDRTVHTVELTKLQPDTYYFFRFGDNSKEFKFRTMPVDLKKPVRFVSGGDVYHQRDWMDQMNSLAAKLDPSFVVLGGDLAYSVPRRNTNENVKRWYDYFDSWKQNAVAPDGRLIPQLVTIGNHEVENFWDQSPEQAKGFHTLFSMPGTNGFNHLDFGNYMTLLLLDSQHTRPVAGEQTEWLDQTLAKRKKVPHVFPVYHIPGYPSAREFDGGENGHISIAIREHWSPLFEKHGVKIVFENHDHAFKRTHPIRNGKVNAKGVTYLGDGAWGVRLRNTHPVDSTWYLAKAGGIRHLFLVTLYPDQRHVTAFDGDGKIFDEVYQRVDKSRALKP